MTCWFRRRARWARAALSIAAGLAWLLSANAHADAWGEHAVTLWSPFLEWNVANPSYTGNPFDVVADVVFTHAESGATHTTEMFFAGDSAWKFRFTGTRTGRWTFASHSDDPELNGHTGSIEVSPNHDPAVRGFLTTSGNKFAIQTGNNGKLAGFVFDVYMNNVEHSLRKRLLHGDPDPNPDIDGEIDALLADTREHGFETAFFSVMQPESWVEGTEPLLRTFEILERAIVAAHSRGMRMHFWMWGDEARSWTPPGGINSATDRRLQRYLAARLGPLPGWTLGYGFDLEEWTTEEQMRSWAEYLHAHMGWRHLLWARGRSNAELDVRSLSSYDVRSYSKIANGLSAHPDRPSLYEERHSYLRNSDLSMAGTRRFLWQQTIAGGFGGFWGFFSDGTHPYPNPEQLETHGNFWHGRNRFLLDMERANELSDGYVLADPSRQHFAIYREAANSIQIDLSSASSALPAVAVDTVGEYLEIDLGTLAPALQSVILPHNSDWALAIGEFAGAEGSGDDDADGIPNGWELQHGFDPEDPSDAGGDADGDGVTNVDEYLTGTHPRDRDGDGVGDDEDAFPEDPAETQDSDADGLGNHTDRDDDNDGMPDAWELLFGFDPLDPADAERDADGDGASNRDEFEADTDPQERGGLVARYPFDGPAEIAIDTSGNGLDGSLAGTAQRSADSQGGFIVVGGDGAGVIVPDSNALDLVGEFTLAVWIRPGMISTQDILKKARFGATDGYALTLSSSGVAFARFNQFSSGNAFRLDAVTPYPRDSETWMHLACTYDGGNLRLYVNGALEANLAAAGLQVGANTLPLSLGAQPDGQRAFHGAIDDARIYERALSSAEIVELLSPPDSDADGIPDDQDAFPFDPAEWLDSDLDGVGNVADTDDDQDGELDGTDAFPLDPNEQNDTDGDGIGNGADTDDDGDGELDTSDAFPLDPTEQSDTDGDGIGNNSDLDDDGDGEPDVSDAFPLDPEKQHESDGEDSNPQVPPVEDVDAISRYSFATGTGNVARDTGSAALDGILSNGPVWVADGPAGEGDNALHFPGNGARVLVDDAHELDLGDRFTLSAWLRPETQSTQYVLKKARYGQVDGYELALSSSGVAFVRFNQKTSGNTYRLDTTTPYPTDGATWVHMAVVFDGAMLGLYVDGLLESSIPAAGLKVHANSLPLSIGAQDDGQRGMRGGVDELRVYARALDAGEIAALAAPDGSGITEGTGTEGETETGSGSGEENGDPGDNQPPDIAGPVVSFELDASAGNIAIDSSGNGLDGDIVGTPRWISGVHAGGLEFDGDGTRLLVPDHALLAAPDALTLSAWIRPHKRATQYVLKKGRYGFVDGFELSLSSSGVAFVRFNQLSRGNAYRLNARTPYPTDGATWSHIVATFDGSELRLYVDGVLEASAETPDLTIPSNTRPLSIGAEDDGTRPFAGAVDAVALWGRALSAEEIQELGQK